MSGSHAHPGDTRPAWWRTPTGVTVIGFALVAAFFVLREHWGHVLGFLPYTLLLACPLMHFFMHRGHGHHHDGAPRPQDRG
jgi:Protein of unknown function (DUF2933)